MITVKQAENILLENVSSFSETRVPLSESVGRILREDIFADRDFPPFHRVAMDGIALNFDAWQRGARIFPIQGIQKAGAPQEVLKDPQGCWEVMTGCVLPKNCDCVIPIENIEIKDHHALVREGFKVIRMLNVHQQGADGRAGETVLRRGARMLAPQVAIAASVGKAQVLVARQPKIAIIGTGDELVAVDQVPESYQIRQSNAYALQAALKTRHYTQVSCFHIRDDKELLEKRLSMMIDKFDVLILSGGVSMGKFDFLPQTLQRLGVRSLFHKVRQRPGKPFWFGLTRDHQPVFALPGNPVATQIGVYRYVLPYLDKASGATVSRQEYVPLDESVDIKTPFTYFLPVKLSRNHDQIQRVKPVYTGGSGDFAALGRTDGFVELPSETFHFSKGTCVAFYPW